MTDYPILPAEETINSKGNRMVSWGPGRDGSPSRPFADGGPYVVRLNGGLGEPALPEAGDPKSKGRPETGWLAGALVGTALRAVRSRTELRMSIGQRPLVGTALRAVRSRTEVRMSFGSTAGSESPPYPRQETINSKGSG